MNFADITLEVVIIGFIVILLIGMLLSGIFFADRKNRFLSLLLSILSLCFIAILLLPIEFMLIFLIFICYVLIIIIYQVGIPRFKPEPDKFLIDKLPQVWDQFERPPETKEESP